MQYVFHLQHLDIVENGAFHKIVLLGIFIYFCAKWADTAFVTCLIITETVLFPIPNALATFLIQSSSDKQYNVAATYLSTGTTFRKLLSFLKIKNIILRKELETFLLNFWNFLAILLSLLFSKRSFPPISVFSWPYPILSDCRFPFNNFAFAIWLQKQNISYNFFFLKYFCIEKMRSIWRLVNALIILFKFI